jgi:hypothetical protein
MKNLTKKAKTKKAITKIENTTEKKSVKKPKVTKTSLVIKHLIEKKHITSWDAINLYNATRLSAIIFTLRKKNGYNIATQNIAIKDIFGNDCIYAKYLLVSLPKKN